MHHNNSWSKDSQQYKPIFCVHIICVTKPSTFTKFNIRRFDSTTFTKINVNSDLKIFRFFFRLLINFFFYCSFQLILHQQSFITPSPNSKPRQWTWNLLQLPKRHAKQVSTYLSIQYLFYSKFIFMRFPLFLRQQDKSFYERTTV